MMNDIDLTDLAVSDVYSLAMFLMFKFKEIPQYSTLSELPYLLKKEDLFHFLNYYGGKTIKIPTHEEFARFLKLILFYQYYKVEGRTAEESLKLSRSTERLNVLRLKSDRISEVLQQYDFKYGEKYE